ncbi:MAG: L,D-transpeptidase family protein, partial [Sphingobium sp.]
YMGARSDRPDPTFILPPVNAATQPRLWYSAGHFPLLTLPGGQTQTVRSILNITGPMRFGTYVWNEAHIPQGPVWVRVDLDKQILSVFRAGHEIGSAVILYGADNVPTPTGSFKILGKAEYYHSKTYNAPMPFALRLTPDWVAIHASDVHDGYATHGCVGVPMEFARLLYAHARIGDPVFIVGGKASGPSLKS